MLQMLYGGKINKFSVRILKLKRVEFLIWKDPKDALASIG